MNVPWQRKAALAFWALLVFWEAIGILWVGIGGYTPWQAAVGPWQVPLLIAFSLEVLAFRQVRRFGEAAQTRWLSAASLLMAVALIMFVVPLYAFAVIFDDYETELINLFTLYLTWVVALVSAVASLASWTVYWVQFHRRRIQATPISQA